MGRRDFGTSDETERKRILIAFITLAVITLFASQTFVVGLAEVPPTEAVSIYVDREHIAAGSANISIVGYVGHLTNHIDVVKICSDRDMEVVLHYRGPVGNLYERHVAIFYVYWSDVNQGVGFIGENVFTSTSVYMPAGQCKSLAASILLTPDMPLHATIVYRIDVEIRRR